MLLVVDANRVISGLLSKGEVSVIFLVNKFLGKFEFVSPEYLFFELGRNIDEDGIVNLVKVIHKLEDKKLAIRKMIREYGKNVKAEDKNVKKSL